MTAHNKNKILVGRQYVSKSFRKDIIIGLLSFIIAPLLLHYNFNLESMAREPEYPNPVVESWLDVNEEDVNEDLEPFKVAKITAYTCDPVMTPEQKAMNCPNGITATGTVPKYGTLACDKYNLGRSFEIEGLNGVFKCEDRGGAINGSGRFDLFLPTIQDARQWGIKHLEYREVIDK